MPSWSVYVKWRGLWFEIRTLRAPSREHAERALTAEPHFCLHSSIFQIHILPTIEVQEGNPAT